MNNNKYLHHRLDDMLDIIKKIRQISLDELEAFDDDLSMAKDILEAIEYEFEYDNGNIE